MKAREWRLGSGVEWKAFHAKVLRDLVLMKQV